MAEFEKRLACVIAADGSIARGYMIDRCELVGANEYVITWKVPLQKEAKTNFSCVIGSAEQEMVEPGFCTVGLMADPDEDARPHLRCRRQAGQAPLPPRVFSRLGQVCGSGAGRRAPVESPMQRACKSQCAKAESERARLCWIGSLIRCANRPTCSLGLFHLQLGRNLILQMI